MSNLCEICPIATKIDYCYSSDPETGTTKEVRLRRTGYSAAVCDKLQSDGSCGIYNERPEACASYSCQKIYEQGLGA